MHVLMLVATPVATDTRVLREAGSLVAAGHRVHVVGRSVPEGYEPPEGVTVSSVGTSSVFRPGGGAPPTGRHPRRLPPHLRLARWALLPQHRRSAFGRWAEGVRADVAARGLPVDVVHAHDFTALEVGAELARERGAPLVYDTHELWSGRPREHRPTPLADRRERRVEARLGREATAVITVGDGVAKALRDRYGWDHVHVVRNTFPSAAPHPPPPPAPVALVYAGRLAAYRELETVAEATRAPGLPLPVTLLGPADDTWLAGFDPGSATVRPPVGAEEVTDLLTAAGLVLVTHSDRWENHRLALPNKLFHAVRAGVPVVATDVGELARTVRAHGIGTLYRPGDATDLRRAVAEATDPVRYAELRARVDAASAQLGWERDERALLEVYDGLGRGGGPRAVPESG
ncbi:glycosyltransferase [Ornithinimicrobium cerasi]|uniref:glycosyltransferase n=1 Tax=Ornithinimicrobium cerasi TaxID=2248773 RepID=UPI000F00BB72|nr:glycosyltransferase [Ornithinimicrobium cerasi]